MNKKTLTKIIAVVLGVVLVAAIAVSVFVCSGNKGDATYVIGVSGPLTGPYAAYGKAVENSAQMAIDEINAAGGLDGVKFKLIALNDEGDGERAGTNYASLMDDGMIVSLGCVTSGACLEFAKLAKEDNLFFLTPSASADDVVKEANAYQMCFADGNQGTVAANYVNSLDYSEIGIFYRSDDAYSRGIYDKFMAELDTSKISTKVATFVETDTDFTAQIDILKDCKFIFMPIYYTPASIFMTQAKGKIANDAVYYGCDGFDGIDTSVEGFDIATIPQEVSMLSHFNSKATEGAAATFIQKYTAKYGADTLNQFGASAYDSVYALFGAMKKAKDAGKDISPDMSASDLCEILKAEFNGGYTYNDGNTGTNIQWSSTGFVNKAASAVVIKQAD